MDMAREEIIRLRDEAIDEMNAHKRIMGGYAKMIAEYNKLLQEMDGKEVKADGKKDITFDDGDDWDWGW